MLLRNPDKIARKYSAVFFQSEASNDCHNLIITHSHMIVNNNLKIFNIFQKIVYMRYIYADVTRLPSLRVMHVSYIHKLAFALYI